MNPILIEISSGVKFSAEIGRLWSRSTKKPRPVVAPGKKAATGGRAREKGRDRWSRPGKKPRPVVAPGRQTYVFWTGLARPPVAAL